jgi:hypothetical protein
MLEIRPIMNSAVEEILGFKTCCGMRTFDQNLEILVTNRGDRPVVVVGRFDLVDERGVYRVRTLMPPGDQRIRPGHTIAFYCMMDESLWAAAREIVFHDTEGNPYPQGIRQPAEEER